MKKVLLIPALLLFMQFLHARTGHDHVIVLCDSINDYKLENYVLVLRDTDKNLKFQDIRNFPDSQFNAPVKGSTNFGYDDAHYWMKLNVIDSSLDANHWHFVLTYALIDSVYLYITDSTETRVMVKGDLTVRDRKEFPHVNHPFPLDFEKNKPYTLYVHFTGNDNKSFPVEIMSESYLSSYNLLNHNFNGIYTGIMVAMILYNLFIFVSIRDRIYLYYTFFAFFMLFASMALNGYTYWLFYPEFIQIANSSNLWSIAATAVFGTLFVYKFLHISPKEKFIFPLLSSIGIFGLILFFQSIIASFMPSIFLGTVKFTSFVTFYFILVMFGIIVYKNVKGVKESRFLLIAWSMYIIGVGISALMYAGAVSDNIVTHYSLQLGSMLEITLLSFALADRLRILERDKKLSDERALRYFKEKNDLMSQQNIMLEQKINERTATITEQKKILEEKSTELTQMVDELTGQNTLVDLLYKELNHRVKNNLQFISSLLNLQSKKIYDEEAKMAMQNSRHRIETISIIHKMLYSTNIKDKVILYDYVEHIINYLNDAVSYKLEYTIENKTEKIALDLDYAIYISLIILEIITNSLKHAFTEAKHSNQIAISSVKKNTLLRIVAKDNGVGFDQENKAKGFGLDLIDILTNQLKGKYEIKSNNGTEFILEFPYHYEEK